MRSETFFLSLSLSLSLLQKQLERVLSLILDDVDVDYDIVVEEVRPVQTHLEVEFYVLRQDNHAPMNATKAYMKLTERGQNFNYYNFHFLKINMKGEFKAC